MGTDAMNANSAGGIGLARPMAGVCSNHTTGWSANDFGSGNVKRHGAE